MAFQLDARDVRQLMSLHSRCVASCRRLEDLAIRQQLDQPPRLARLRIGKSCRYNEVSSICTISVVLRLGGGCGVPAALRARRLSSRLCHFAVIRRIDALLQRVCKVEVKRAKSLSVRHSITALTVLAAPSLTDASSSGVVDKFTEPLVRAVDHVGEAGGGADDISAIFRL